MLPYPGSPVRLPNLATPTLPSTATTDTPCCRRKGFPFIAISTFLLTSVVAKTTGQGQNHYTKAGGVANEVRVGLKNETKTPGETVMYL